MKESYRKGESESILTASFARVVARRHVKRKQGHWWAGLLSFENIKRVADAVEKVEGKTGSGANASGGQDPRSLRPWHAKKLHAREPGDLRCA